MKISKFLLIIAAGILFAEINTHAYYIDAPSRFLSRKAYEKFQREYASMDSVSKIASDKILKVNSELIGISVIPANLIATFGAVAASYPKTTIAIAAALATLALSSKARNVVASGAKKIGLIRDMTPEELQKLKDDIKALECEIDALRLKPASVKNNNAIIIKQTKLGQLLKKLETAQQATCTTSDTEEVEI